MAPHPPDQFHRESTPAPSAATCPVARTDQPPNPARLPTGIHAQDNAERLRAIVETAVDGIITIDASGTIETMNPAAERMFGYPVETIVGQNISRLMPEPFRSEHNSYLARYLTSGERRIIGIGREVLGQRRDGPRFPLELSVSEMHLDGRRMFTGIVRDVTERRAAEEKLRRLAALLDDSNDAIKTLDLRGNIMAWNPGAERLYGYSAPSALQRNVRDLLPIERADEVRLITERLVRREKVPPFETQRITADGRLVDIQCTMTLLSGRSDQPDAIVVTDRDITERKQAEAALRGSEAKTRAIVEAAVDGIITIDAVGTIESTNRAAERLFGYDAAELVGQNVSMLMPSPYHEEHDGYIRRYKRTGVKKIIGVGREVVGRRKDGTTFPMELAISEMIVDDRRMFTGIVRDISERKRIERELMEQAVNVEQNNQVLQQANSRAEEATAAKSAFLANMSHEIRTPMTAILGFTDQLQDPDLSADDRAEAIETIRRHGQYLLTILNDILDLSKIEAGKLDVEHIRCSPAEVAREVESLMRVRAEARALSLGVHARNSIPAEVETDPTRVKQILLNLVGNALKFTESGGVELIVGLDGEGAEATLTFDVIDTGIGMTQEQIQRLFRPFAQADSSTTRRYGGTGLGLSICKRVAELLGGGISVQSTPGRGSRFRLSVPARLAEGARLIGDILPQRSVSPAPAADAVDTLDGTRVLLAEDGPDNQRLISYLLGKAGARVDVVDNGRAAVEAVNAAERSGMGYEVVLMDMQMPVMDGYEATASLRRLGYAGPIIALTAHAMSGDRDRCVGAGCTDYGVKPIDRAALIGMIRRYAAGAERRRVG